MRKLPTGERGSCQAGAAMVRREPHRLTLPSRHGSAGASPASPSRAMNGLGEVDKDMLTGVALLFRTSGH